MLERRTGVKRFLSGLIPALARAAPDFHISAWMGFFRKVHGEGYPAWGEPNVKNRIFRFPRRWIERAWSLDLLPAERIAPGALIFHSFWYHLPPSRRCRRILTVFDFREVVFPDMYPEESDRLRSLLSRNLEGADRIVASSRATANDLRSHFQLAGREIDVVYGGVEGSFTRQPDAAVAATREKLRLQGPYIVTMGSGDPRKNIPRFIRAFIRYLRESRDDLRLVITGARHPSYDPALLEVEASGLSQRILYVGETTDEEWRNLLSGAEALVYPSLYEGFGLPPLEAMACGTPVLASTTPAVKEWAGDAALYFDPQEMDSMVKVLLEFRGSRTITGRLRQAGAGRVKEFTWERIAGDYLRIYRQVLGESA